MGGRGAGSGRAGGGGGINPGDVLSQKSLISEREGKGALVDAALQTLRELNNEYGEVVSDLRLATLKNNKRSAGVLGFSNGDDVSINEKYFGDNMESAYAQSVKAGYHPSNGNKTGLQAVVAHEMGHNMTLAAGRKMGINNIDGAATRIVNEARKATGHRGVVQMASKISRYATASNAEAVAEAVADVYSNGSRAARESRAIVDVMKKYL